MALQLNGSWNGWSGDTIVELTDGSVWKQIEYRYEYRYSYRPKVEIRSNKMLVAGMNRAVRVKRLANVSTNAAVRTSTSRGA